MPTTSNNYRRPDSPRWDVFISHASEDKDAFARPLARELAKLGLSVWFDEFVLKPGDSLRRSIDLGLRSSEFVVAVLSRAYFRKHWTQRELDAVFSREKSEKSMLIPIWYDATLNEVRDFSPMLADRIAIIENDPARAAQRVFKTVRPSVSPGELSGVSMETKLAITFIEHTSRGAVNGEPLEYRIRGVVTDLLPAAVSFLVDQLSKREGKGWDVVPHMVAGELLVNAVAHRDYTLSGDIAVEIREGAILVRNPGLLVRPLTLDVLTTHSRVVLRNARLVGELVAARYMEAMGVGLARVTQQLARAGLPPLAFKEEGTSFQVSLEVPGR